MIEYDQSLTPWQTVANIWQRMSRVANSFFMSRYFNLYLFCLAAFTVVTDQQVKGALLFVGIICLVLVLCEDLFATTLPFLLLCVFLCQCYDSYDIFIEYLWLVIPVLLCIVFHFVVYRKPLVIGSTFWGLAAVSIALLLGGTGVLPHADYFRPTTLYYTLSLGVGMMVAYLLIKSQLSTKRDYDPKEKFLTYLYIMGMFACFLVLRFVLENWDMIKETEMIPGWQPSNNACTFLMIAMPCPFFFVSRNRAHLLSPFLIFLCMILAGSRSGLLLGTVELSLCLLLAAYMDPPRRFPYICLTAALVGLILWRRDELLRFSTSLSWQELIRADEARFQLIGRAKDSFLENPLFGHGLGYRGNTDLYSPTKGAMEWYHMMIPQVVGSMGILGIVAYLSQLVLQMRATLLPFRKITTEERSARLALAMSYLGLLIMSQVNPGIFCPLPYTLIGTMIFALMDGNSGTAWLHKIKKR